MTTISDNNIFYQVSHDVAGEKTTDARFVGVLDPGRTLLNVDSALSGKDQDKLDTFRINLTKNAPLGVTATQSDGKALKVEVLDRSGRVIADNTARSGRLKDAWDQISASTYNAKKGSYYVRVSRGAGVAASADEKYSLQIRSGFDHKQEYNTVEKRQTTSVVATTGQAALMATMAAQMQTSANNIYNEKASATQNLFTSLLGSAGFNITV